MKEPTAAERTEGLPRVVPAAVTPFTKGGASVMLDWIPQYLTYIEHRGADGVLAMGTNGEGPSLALDERREIVDAVETHRGRLFTIHGTGCAALPDTVELSRYAVERGAGAVMIVPPFYFKDLDDDGLIAYYSAVLEMMPAERKVMLYNIPSVSGVEITDGLLDALVERYPDRVLGLKDTSSDVERTRRYVQRYPQLVIYNGSDHNVDAGFAAGAYGTISAVANVFADLIASVLDAHVSGHDVAAAQREVNRVREAIKRYPSHGAIKFLLHRIGGLPPAYVRPPLRDLTPEEMRDLARTVEQELALA